MSCPFCKTECGSLNPGMPPEGTGSVLIVLDEISSEQDYNGTYYAGAVGRLLLDVLQRCGLRRQDCTVWSCSPCLGRGTAPEHLARNLLQLSFKSYILLGDEALRFFCKKSGIKDKRGQSFKLHKDYGIDADVWPTYGLDLVRRVPNYRNVVVSDVQRAIGRNRVATEVSWEWWDGQELPDSDVYSYDIETIDEKGEYTQLATQCAVAGANFCYVSRPNEVSATFLASALRTRLESSPGSVIVGHNSWQFDIPRTRLAHVHLPMGEDTMVLAYLEDETQPKGLESLSVKHLGVKGWKDEFSHPLGSDGFAQYNARDVVHTLALYRKLRAILGPRIVVVDEILRPAHIALTRMAERGIYISPTAVARERTKAESEAAESLSAVLAIIGNADFNPGSNKQVGEYLQAQGEVLPLTSTGKPAVSVKVLNEIDTEFTRELLKYRGAKKTLGTYVENYEKIIAADGRVHPVYSVVRTLTGRSASSSLNVQNLPREYKDFFAAPPGKVFCEVDYSAIEFRVAAWVAQEQTILERFRFNPHWDPHRFFAAHFYGKREEDVTKDERQIAKSANFGLLYMGTGFTLIEYAAKMGLYLTLQFCDNLYRMWHEVFPGFKKLYLDTKEELIATSEIHTATGHIRHFGDITIMPNHLKAEALRQGVNVKVQGLAAHIAYLGMAELDRRNMPMTGFIHDALLFEFDSKAECEKLLPEIEQVMNEHPPKILKEKFGISFDVPLTTEAKWRVC